MARNVKVGRLHLSLQVLNFGVACDGVQLGSNYTVNMYLARCRDAPPDIAVRSSNVQLFCLIPGPKDPKNGFVQHTSLVLDLLVALGPHSGMPVYNIPVESHCAHTESMPWLGLIQSVGIRVDYVTSTVGVEYA
jgi:hypothetical protein